MKITLIGPEPGLKRSAEFDNEQVKGRTALIAEGNLYQYSHFDMTEMAMVFTSSGQPLEIVMPAPEPEPAPEPAPRRFFGQHTVKE